MALYQVTSDYFCAGLVTENNIVIKAAPIIAWMVGKILNNILPYIEKKQWKIMKIQ